MNFLVQLYYQREYFKNINDLAPKPRELLNPTDPPSYPDSYTRTYKVLDNCFMTWLRGIGVLRLRPCAHFDN